MEKDIFYKIKNPIWLALYTKGNHEKKVNELLKKFNIHSFLPTRNVTIRGKERKIPLFRSYVFVKVVPRSIEFYRAMDLGGVVGYVKNNGVPAIIKDKEIEAIKIMLRNFREVFPIYILDENKEILLKKGPFKGFKVRVINADKNKRKIVIWVKEILSGASIEVKKEEFLAWI